MHIENTSFVYLKGLRLAALFHVVDFRFLWKLHLSYTAASLDVDYSAVKFILLSQAFIISSRIPCEGTPNAKVNLLIAFLSPSTTVLEVIFKSDIASAQWNTASSDGNPRHPAPSNGQAMRISDSEGRRSTARPNEVW
mmetsp:Transcript_41272/g.99426  ORF Transcript_41272/g.99426 Transcript_41272/m.99426 type:complete len:138 (+) Transcript_41272:441-854(+)